MPRLEDSKFCALFNDYPEVNKLHMGFHDKWSEEPIWKS